jgi:hypothetical protein
MDVCFGLDVASDSMDPTYLWSMHFIGWKLKIVAFHWVHKVGTYHCGTLKMGGRDILVPDVTLTFAHSPCPTPHPAEPSVTPVGNRSP